MPKRILLILGGGIAAYKCLDLIRRLAERGVATRAIMTRAAERFVTPLSVGALTNERVFTDLFSLDDEREIGHIRLSREADLVVVAPATADLIAKMAGGHADDLATAALLATDKPVLVAPAMNPRMWSHPATQRNVQQLRADGVRFIGPSEGEMAERGEAGLGRLAEVPDLVAAIEEMLGETRLAPDLRPDQGEREREDLIAGACLSLGLRPGDSEGTAAERPLAGRHVLVTSGPTHEAIDPVRYLANRSSGKQGHAIAAAAAQLGARVTLVCGPVTIADPNGANVVRVESAAEMMRAVRAAMPADVAVMAAAVADWRVVAALSEKVKKRPGGKPAPLELVENEDILRVVARETEPRPALVIGFAAETEAVLDNAAKKLAAKGADWIVANDVSSATGVMGGDTNRVHLVTAGSVEHWPALPKAEVGLRLMQCAAAYLANGKT